MALDFYEERKWKRAIASLLAQQCAAKCKKNKTKKKLDELYKRCMCLYLSMNVNNNFFDISQGIENKKMSIQLNKYIKENSNIEYFNEQFKHWRITLDEIKLKLEKKFGSIKNAKHFLKVLELMENMVHIQEESVKRRMTEGDITMSQNGTFIDLNLLDKEMSEMLKEITIEIDDEMFTVSKSTYSPRSLNEDDIITNINPKQLFYNTKDLPNNISEFALYLEKNQEGKTDLLPRYDYKKMLISTIDKNKQIDEFEKEYFKVFPALYLAEKNPFDKKLIHSEIDVYKTKDDRITSDCDLVRLFNLKFERFTTIQNLILLWGVMNYGMNSNIISEIPNIYGITKSLSYDNEEIMVYLNNKIFDKYDIEMLVSNFDILTSTRRSSSRLIYYMDPPMLNSLHYDFYYNNLMNDYINSVKSDSHIQLAITNIKHYDDRSPGIQLIENNPIFQKTELKQEIYNKLKHNLKNICERVKKMTEECESNLQKIYKKV
jgi:hypothetical protein